MLGHQASARGRVAGCRAPHSWRRGRDSGEAAGRPPTWSLCPRHSRVHVSGCGRTDGGTTEASSAHRSLGNWLPARPPPSGLRSGPSSVSRAAGPRGSRVPALCFGFLICRSSLGRTLCLIVLKTSLATCVDIPTSHSSSATPAAPQRALSSTLGLLQAMGLSALRQARKPCVSPPWPSGYTHLGSTKSSWWHLCALLVWAGPLYPVIGGLAWHTPAAHIPRGRGPHGWSQAAGVEARRWSGALALSPPFKLRGRI
uniref:Uncharacterized protein n=1 Tax=Rangifer tarandus platyrhynchus TaxID=3082113 RepID=A0ACB0EHV9_RANTA|nr:unnamed protein product [Rangifer tarandus platyrhynchus]